MNSNFDDDTFTLEDDNNGFLGFPDITKTFANSADGDVDESVMQMVDQVDDDDIYNMMCATSAHIPTRITRTEVDAVNAQAWHHQRQAKKRKVNVMVFFCGVGKKQSCTLGCGRTLTCNGGQSYYCTNGCTNRDNDGPLMWTCKVDDYDNPVLQISSQKREEYVRGNQSGYKCGVCGQPKKNHVCTGSRNAFDGRFAALPIPPDMSLPPLQATTAAPPPPQVPMPPMQQSLPKVQHDPAMTLQNVARPSTTSTNGLPQGDVLHTSLSISNVIEAASTTITAAATQVLSRAATTTTPAPATTVRPVTAAVKAQVRATSSVVTATPVRLHITAAHIVSIQDRTRVPCSTVNGALLAAMHLLNEPQTGVDATRKIMLSHFQDAFVAPPEAGHDAVVVQLMAIAKLLGTSCIRWNAHGMQDPAALHKVVASSCALCTADDILAQMRTRKDVIQLEFDGKEICAAYVPSTPLYTETTLYRVLAQAFPMLTSIDYDADWFVVEDHDCCLEPVMMHSVSKASSISRNSLRAECVRLGYNAFSYDSWSTRNGSGDATVVFYNFSQRITDAELTPRKRPHVQSFPCAYTHELHVHNGFRA